MLNYRKIAKVLVVAAFFCTFIGAMNNNAMAADDVKITRGMVVSGNGNKSWQISAKYNGSIYELNGKKGWERIQYANSGVAVGRHSVNSSTVEVLNKAVSQHGCPDGSLPVNGKCIEKKVLVDKRCSDPQYKNTEECIKATGGASADKSTADVKAAGSNTEQSGSKITGCSKNTGLFSGLITTGEKIFKGLRDLIYVVAGFGIIGVAVGGFFGNLNWKWLGAIIIGLVVIATTGELINAITGCPNYTSGMIADTLK